jgi:hypothetical protein
MPQSRYRLWHGAASSRKLVSVALLAESGDSIEIDSGEPIGETGGTQTQAALPKALQPSTPLESSPDQQDEDSPISEEDVAIASSQVFMLTREMRRTMIEELGYKRNEVDFIRLELVANIIENRIRCPSEGMPVEWVDADRESANESVRDNNNNSSMMQKLESESKYPLKFPLLGISLVLFGKGFSDALITLIKVNIDFPGATLTAQFQGVPVLAIDGVCVIAGAALGIWTFKTMR